MQNICLYKYWKECMYSALRLTQQTYKQLYIHRMPKVASVGCAFVVQAACHSLGSCRACGPLVGHMPPPLHAVNHHA